MKRRILNLTGIGITVRHCHRFLALHPSRLRKVISVALIITFVLVPLLQGRAIFTPPALAQVSSCGGANRIFQGCPLGEPYEVSLENQALDDLLTLHDLPAVDRSRLLGWQRNELRAALYDKLLGVIKKAPSARPDGEIAALNALATRLKQKRIEPAQYAVEEYNKWKSSPCTHTPPTGFTYSGVAQCAGARLNPNATVDPPKFEEFQAYGVARAYSQFQDVKTQRILNQVVRGVSFLGGLAGVGIAGAVVGANVPTAVIRVIFPFAVRAFASGASAGTAAGTGAAK